MMKYICLLSVSIVLFTLTACRNSVETQNQSSDKCRYFNDKANFQDQLFPFEFKDFKTKNILQYFNKGAKVDSSELNNEGYITRTYNFSDGNSTISFLVKPFDKADSWFYLRSSTIRSNIINFKNGIKIGMDRNDFNKIIDKKNNCDTFLIQEGDMVMSYFFIFKNNKLENIEILAPED